MRNKILLFTAIIQFICIICLSCKHQDKQVLLPELNRAEKLIYQYPDSALRILEQVSKSSLSNDLQHSTWCLLITQAKYKNYIKQPSDSIINIAYKYFINKDNPQRKALVLYLKGALNEEWKEIEKALQYYLEAAEEVDKTNDYQLGHLINRGLGTIYAYRSLFDYAEESYLKAYNYAKLSYDTVYISSSLSYLGRLYAGQSNWDKAIEYYEDALNVGLTKNNIRSHSRILSELSGAYSSVGNYSLALKYAKESLELRENNDLNPAVGLFTVGNIYRLIGNNDSAYHYLNKSLVTGNIYTKRSAYHILYSMSKEQGQYLKALEYNDEATLYSDSIHKSERSNTLIEMQEKYNQEKILNEKNQLKIERDRTVRSALVISLLLLFVIAILIYIYQRKLIQKERTIQKNEEQIRIYTLKIHENDSLIKRNLDRIEELTVEMGQSQEIQELLDEQQSTVTEIKKQNQILQKENQELQKNICYYSNILQEKAEELDALNRLSLAKQYLQDRERFLCKQLVKKTKILNDLKVSPKYMDAARWEEVKEEIDKLYDDYTKRLTKEIPSLTESDLQICCLIKLHLGIQEIAILLGISPTSVSKRKLRLKERITQEVGKSFSENQTLDLWLWEY